MAIKMTSIKIYEYSEFSARAAVKLAKEYYLDSS
jgi:hypothetical protein